jgi:aminopeptidase N
MTTMAMQDSVTDVAPRLTFLKEYRAADFVIAAVQLRFELREEESLVSSQLSLRRRIAGQAAPLVLAGRELELLALSVNGRPLAPSEYCVSADDLTIHGVPDECVVEVTTRIQPQKNTSLMGLYKSGGNFCTQCEAEGFRKITYYLDRPDVLAVFTTTIIADKGRYPVLLSNGNLHRAEELPDGSHVAVWHDPFPKPSYLFALVAGDLAQIRDEFITCSGRRVALHFYVQHHNADRCAHAVAALKKAMRWDEEVYGREYDLDNYMVVAVDDFNMGAMENKGLNVFNSKYVLANAETATDADYQAIESIIGHEYFHNWSGNRVTCRDWFQLSLKEGFTVFRDQQFSADIHSRGVKRIQDVNYLRTYQFREDAGPTAHPVRPTSYMEINNFYTTTVYQKGAEVVRMLYRLVGPATFRRGTDLYFSRYDGQAVTTDDFVAVMEEVGGERLDQFKLWYSQAGTPEVIIRGEFDISAQTYTLDVQQRLAATPGQPEKQPMHIPLSVALFGRDGRALPLHMDAEASVEVAPAERVLSLRASRERFVFHKIVECPVPSLLRGFSAPVKLTTDLSDADWAFLLSCDNDEVNRWEAGQRLALTALLGLVSAIRSGAEPRVGGAFIDAFGSVLRDTSLDPAFASQVLAVPDEAYVAEFMEEIDPQAIHDACRILRKEIATLLRDDLWRVRERLTDNGPYTSDSLAVGRRRLKNICLAFLIELPDATVRGACLEQFERATNMTDVIAALLPLANTECEERDIALDRFYQRWQHDTLVLDKWLSLQATSRLADTLARVQELLMHPAFNIKNPNKVRSLIGAFCLNNPVNFHRKDGAGYVFLSEQILAIDPINPQVAARLAHGFSLWRRFDSSRQALMERELRRIAGHSPLSRDVYEVISATLGD